MDRVVKHRCDFPDRLFSTMEMLIVGPRKTSTGRFETYASKTNAEVRHFLKGPCAAALYDDGRTMHSSGIKSNTRTQERLHSTSTIHDPNSFPPFDKSTTRQTKLSFASSLACVCVCVWFSFHSYKLDRPTSLHDDAVRFATSHVLCSSLAEPSWHPL